MSTDFYLFEMATGLRLTPLPVSKGSWSIATNADEKTGATIPVAKVTRDLQIWESTTLARNGLLVVVDDEPVAAGPIWKRDYTQGKTIGITAGGLRSYWERRLLLPVDARGMPLVDENGDPITSYDFEVSGVDIGTIGKRYIELVQLWPGGSIPVLLPADVAGDASDTVKAIDLKTVRRLIDNLSGRANGPDIAFRPRWNADRTGIYWEYQAGTAAVPRLGNTDPDLIKWSVGAPRGGAFDLQVSEDGTGLAGEIYFHGGAGKDQVIMARGYDSTLEDDGYPLLQKADTGHTDVTEQATAQDYADQGVYLGKHASSFWSMKVRAHEPGSPRLGDFWLGDLATITVDAAEPVLPAGDVVRRVAAISGDEVGAEYDIAFAEALEAVL